MAVPPTPEQLRAVIQARTKRARLHRDLTQEDMAGLLGVGLDTYKKWENRGKSVIQPQYVDRFCKITGLSHRDLFAEKLDANDLAVIGSVDPQRAHG